MQVNQKASFNTSTETQNSGQVQNKKQTPSQEKGIVGKVFKVALDVFKVLLKLAALAGLVGTSAVCLASANPMLMGVGAVVGLATITILFAKLLKKKTPNSPETKPAQHAAETKPSRYSAVDKDLLIQKGKDQLNEYKDAWADRTTILSKLVSVLEHNFVGVEKLFSEDAVGFAQESSEFCAWIFNLANVKPADACIKKAAFITHLKPGMSKKDLLDQLKSELTLSKYTVEILDVQIAALDSSISDVSLSQIKANKYLDNLSVDARKTGIFSPNLPVQS